MPEPTRPPHALRYDPASSIIEVTMRGFWTLSDHAAYVADIRALAGPLVTRKKWFGIVVDNTEFVVQSTEVSEALIRSVHARRAGTDPAPTAMIVKGALSRMQAQRIGNAPHVRVVDTRAEALDWMAANAPVGWTRPV